MAPQREWFEKDYYAVLGVKPDADQKEITRAYRKLARETHPDANGGSDERFKAVSAAYDVVGDPDKRGEYDEVRRLGPATAGGGPGGPGGFNVGDLGDLFGGIFNRGRGSGGPSRGAGPQRGSDLETELHLAFADAVRGVTTSVNLTSDAPCSTCHGSGAEPGTTPVTCPTCSGRGVVEEDQGFFSFSSTCRTCGGRGQVVETPCHTCRGSGVERRPRTVKVRIPAGVEDAQRIRVKGRGLLGANGGPAGDLYVVVRAGTSPVFGRKGRDLTLAVPVTYPEAALGADVAIPTLEGAPVTLRLPAGTRSGRTFRVRGRGVPATSGAGDLLATVEVVVPVSLSDEERSLVEQLASMAPTSPRAHLGVDATDREEAPADA